MGSSSSAARAAPSPATGACDRDHASKVVATFATDPGAPRQHKSEEPRSPREARLEDAAAAPRRGPERGWGPVRGTSNGRNPEGKGGGPERRKPAPRKRTG